MGIQQMLFSTTLVSGPLSAYASPSSVDEQRADAGTLSGGVSIIASGGTAPYTYSSSFIAGGTSILLSGTSSSSPGVSSSGAPELTRTGTVRTVVTDSVLASVNVDWDVTLVWTTV